MKINRVSIGQRLALAFGVVLLGTILMALAGAWAQRSTHLGMVSVGQDALQLTRALANFERVLADRNLSTWGLATQDDATALIPAVKQFKASRAEFDAVAKELADALGTNDKALGILTQVKTRVSERMQPVVDEAVNLALSGDPLSAAKVAREKLNVERDAVSKLLGQLRDEIVAQAESEYQRGSVMARTTITTLLLAAALLTVCGGVLAWLIARSVTQPMRRTVDVVREMATGNLGVSPTDTDGRDETATLAQAISEMGGSWRGLVAQVRSGAQQVADTSAVLATRNTELAERTEEQLSRLNNTTATMRSIASAAQTTDHSAQQAAQMTHAAVGLASDGAQAVQKVVATIGEIATESKRIGEIVGLIDSIAFQTNILALNAAVEAARAGENGRGFAVVASEVRALAQRSAAASKDIKDLIDQTLTRIDRGSNEAGRASSTIGSAMEQVRQVNDLMAQISRAVQEQTASIAQVSEEAEQLDEITRRNAQIVELGTQAGVDMRQQADDLTRTMAVFRGVAGDAAPTQPALALR